MNGFAKSRFVLLVELIVCCGAPALHADERSSIMAEAIPFLQDHCIRCHGSSEAKGDLRLDHIDSDLSRPATFERWQRIIERVQAGEMPPKDEPQPKSEHVAEFVKLLNVA